jgi:hypothetical protein
MEKFQQRALCRIIIFTVCFWSPSGLAGPQPAYLKMSTAAQRDRWCKPTFLGHRHTLKVRRLMEPDIQGAYPHEPLFRCQNLPFHE